MTENTMAAPPFEDEGGNRKTMIIAGGAIGALVLAGGGFLLLHGGGSSSGESLGPVPHAKPKVVKTPTSAPDRAPVRTSVKKLPAASAAQIGRDPFAALYIIPAAPAAGAAGGTSPTGSSSTSTTSTGGSTTPGSTTSTTPGTTSGARYAVTLTKITKDPGGAYLFTFSVAGKPKTVLAAQRFGNYGELVVLAIVRGRNGAPVGAFLQVGDDNPIEVMVGAKASVE